MAKAYGKCKLCKSDKFLNFAGLCKRCNSKKEGLEIIGKVIEKQKEKLEAQEGNQEQKDQEQREKHALEERDDLTMEQKERLVELTPGVKDVAELDKKLEEKPPEEEKKVEEKPEEKKD